ncbi:hypothetical protein PMIN04_009447 [Paraphaeosphaeria minitans]
MQTRLDSEAAIDGVAELTKRTSQLSHTLFDIASGLVVDTDSDSSVPQSICNVASEFADIAQLCMEACTLLEKSKGRGKNTDAGNILGRLDILLREFEGTLKDFVPNKVPKWLKAMFRNDSANLVTKCHSVKEPLRLLLSVLRIAEVHRSSNKTSNKKKKKKEENALSMAMECECAESWVETNRQVIKVLMNAERRLQKGFPRELLQLPHWPESPGATAAWIYNMIFGKMISAQRDAHRPTTRGARVKTIHTTDGNGTASDSEEEDDDDVLGLIPPDLERKLDQSPVRCQVINELLERWTGLNFQEVRQITGTNNKGQSRLQDTARRVVKWYRKNEKSSDDGSSPPIRNRDKRRIHEDDPNRSFMQAKNTNQVEDEPAVPAPTPPRSSKPSADQSRAPTQSIPRSSEVTQSAEEDINDHWGTFIGAKSRQRQKGKNVVGEEQVYAKDTSKAFVFGDARMPSKAALEKQNAIGSNSGRDGNSIQSPGATSSILGQFGEDEPNPWAETNLEPGQSSKDAEILVEEISELDLDTITAKGKAPAPVVSRAPSPDIILPKESESSSSRPIILRNGMKETQRIGGQEVRITVRPEPKKSTLAKASTSESNGRRSQSAKKHTSRQTSSKVEFVELELEPEPEHTSDRRSRDQHAPTRESSRNKKDEDLNSRVSTRHNTQSTRHRSSIIPPESQLGSSMNSYNTGAVLQSAILPPLSYPAGSGFIGHYMSPYVNHYPMGFYEQSSSSGGSKSSDIAEKLNLLIETEKARRFAEEARRKGDLDKAQRDEKLFMALEEREEQTNKIILELQENARRKEAKWEDEKRNMENKVNAQARLDEQTRRRIEPADTRTSQYKDELDRLYGIIGKFNEEKRRDLDMERERMENYANTELERRIAECEEQQQEALEEALEESRLHYEELINTEQKKAQEAIIRAEVYVKKYNEEFARRSKPKEPSIVSGTAKTNKEKLNVFDFLERPEQNSSLASSHEAETGTETDDLITESELLENQWRERGPYMHAVPQPRIRRFTAASDATSSAEETSNIIVFPPRAGWNDMGHNQLGNYLSMSGFTPYFEEREPSSLDPTGRREKIGTGGNVLRGTLFWQPPASTAEADLYKSLRSSGWRPTYVRTTVSGQTWFFGAQPVHAQFFSDMYKPQVGAYRVSHARPDTEKESLIISKELVEIEELEFLGHIYREIEGKIFLDPTLTSEDIDHIVARSFLAREGKYRKRFRNTQLRASQTKVDITELASDVGDSVSEISFGGGRERTVSLWSLWSPWSR